MVRIRLRRMGAHKRPFYRIIAADSRNKRDGRFIETLGYYDPLTQPATVKVDAEKYQKWLKNGAQPSETVVKILKRTGALEASAQENQPVTPMPTAAPAQEKAEAPAQAEETAQETAPAEAATA